MDFETNEIYTGTPEKAFLVAKQGMDEYYSEETAGSFFESYCDQSLSFILAHYDTISREPYYGVPFCEHLAEHSLLSPGMYHQMIEAVSSNIDAGKNKQIPENQLGQYEGLRTKLQSQLAKLKGTEVLVQGADKDWINVFCDLLFELENRGTEEELSSMLENLANLQDPYTFFVIAPLVLSKYPDYAAPVIYQKTKAFYQPYEKDMNPELLRTSLQTITALNFLKEDEFVIHALKSSGNTELLSLWYKIMNDSVGNYEAARTRAMPAPEHVVINAVHAVEQVIEESTDETLYLVERYDNLVHRKVILEHIGMRQTLFPDKYTLNTEKQDYLFQELAETEAEMCMLEWEANGEPNAVVKDHIMTQKDWEKEEAAKKEKEKKDTSEKGMERDDESEEKGITPENRQMRQRALDVLVAIHKKDENIVIRYNKKDVKEFLAGKANEICLGAFNSNTVNKAKTLAKEAMDDFDDFRIVIDNYYTIYLKIGRDSEYYMESSSTILPCDFSFLYEAEDDEKKKEESDSEEEKSEVKKKSPSTPEKPETDWMTKRQNRAIDKDVKRKERKARIAEKKSKLKNLGKAKTSGIKGEIDSGVRFTQKMDKADENRRKKFMLKPGYRHRIIRNFRHALMYGTVARINIFWTPWLALLRHFSKDKDRRIRNELVRELNTEIKICEEKISDANAKGETDEKYKLMRIKEKLIAEKNRVEINAKYI